MIRSATNFDLESIKSTDSIRGLNDLARGFSVLIPDGESHYAWSVLTCLRQVPGLRSYVLSASRSSVLKYSRLKDGLFYSNDDNTANWTEQVLATAAKLKADIILPVGDHGIRKLIGSGGPSISPAVMAPIPDRKSFDVASDKWLLAKFMQENYIPTPETTIYESNAQLENITSSVRFPVLTKPVHGFGGKGIHLWNERSDLIGYLKDLRDPRSVIIQTFVRGFGIDCSVLCNHGKILAYTVQKESIRSSAEFRFPSGVRFVHNDEVHGVAGRLMSALNWSGVAHIDMIFDEADGRIKVLEINPRYWTSLLGSLSVGINFPYLQCLVGMGMETSIPGYCEGQFITNGKRAIGATLKSVMRLSNPRNVVRNSILKFQLKDPVLSAVMLYRSVSKKLVPETSDKLVTVQEPNAE